MHVLALVAGLHADQVVVPAAAGGGAEGSAVAQRLLPRLLLPHQDQVGAQAHEGKAGFAVLGGHLLVSGGDGDAVARGAGLL